MRAALHRGFVLACAILADDDGDGKIDCADPDCAESPSCKAHLPCAPRPG